MSKVLLVVEDPAEWSRVAQGARVLSLDTYLADYPVKGERSTRVINLCGTSRYLSKGYYCSLLAEARGHRVVQSSGVVRHCEQTIRTVSLSHSRREAGVARAMAGGRDPGGIIRIAQCRRNQPVSWLSGVLRRRLVARAQTSQIKPVGPGHSRQSGRETTTE